jgi:hypothetical protein
MVGLGLFAAIALASQAVAPAGNGSDVVVLEAEITNYRDAGIEEPQTFDANGTELITLSRSTVATMKVRKVLIGTFKPRQATAVLHMSADFLPGKWSRIYLIARTGHEFLVPVRWTRAYDSVPASTRPDDFGRKWAPAKLCIDEDEASELGIADAVKKLTDAGTIDCE